MTNKIIIGIVIYCLFFFFLDNFYDLFKEYKFRWAYHFLFTFFEFSFFTFFIIQHVSSKKTRTILITVSLIFIAFLAFYYKYFPLNRLDAVPIGIETILLYIFIMPYLFSQFRAESSPQIFKQYHFWIVVGIMTYLAGTFFFNILANEIDKTQIRDYWYLSYLGDIFKNLLFTFSIYVYAKGFSKKSDNIKVIPNLDFTS